MFSTLIFVLCLFGRFPLSLTAVKSAARIPLEFLITPDTLAYYKHLVFRRRTKYFLYEKSPYTFTDVMYNFHYRFTDVDLHYTVGVLDRKCVDVFITDESYPQCRLPPSCTLPEKLDNLESSWSGSKVIACLATSTETTYLYDNPAKFLYFDRTNVSSLHTYLHPDISTKFDNDFTISLPYYILNFDDTKFAMLSPYMFKLLTTTSVAEKISYKVDWHTFKHTSNPTDLIHKHVIEVMRNRGRSTFFLTVSIPFGYNFEYECVDHDYKYDYKRQAISHNIFRNAPCGDLIPVTSKFAVCSVVFTTKDPHNLCPDLFNYRFYNPEPTIVHIRSESTSWYSSIINKFFEALKELIGSIASLLLRILVDLLVIAVEELIRILDNFLTLLNSLEKHLELYIDRLASSFSNLIKLAINLTVRVLVALDDKFFILEFVLFLSIFHYRYGGTYFLAVLPLFFLAISLSKPYESLLKSFV